MPRSRRATPRTRSLPRAEALALQTVEAELRTLARDVGLLGAATPRDAHVERARLRRDYAEGRERLPLWTYDLTPATHTHRLRRLDALAAPLRAALDTPLGELYRARADELRLELEAALAVATPRFAVCAEARFPPSAEHGEAAALALSWCLEPPAAVDSPRIASDDRDPRSLVSRLRAEVARRELPFAVRTSPSMSALAAISGDTIWVAEGRLLGLLDIERTVVHEIEAHALPRTRARSLPVAVFAIGTAGGSDDQEGYALWLEVQRGLSGPGRRRELGARHEAVARMRDGADFVSVVRALRARDLDLEDALRIAERAFRGSNGVAPGLGRERVYLEAFVRVRDHLASRPDDEPTLSAGQVSLSALGALRAWAP